MDITVNDQCIGDKFSVYRGDSCEIIKGIPDNSIHFSVYSPPFESLYTYSNSERDMGNSKTSLEFARHFRFLANELYRITMPGRNMSVHCMDLPKSKQRDGVIGLRDFRGVLIRIFERAGFTFHSNVTIWKDPVVAMQRTKALGLLHKQVKKDSCRSRQGVPDYLLTFRKDGDNPEPVAGEFDAYSGDEQTMIERSKFIDNMSDNEKTRFSIDTWQRYASPVWMDINPSDTLQKTSARENADERHIAPLQLQVIERAIQLWSNPNDIVFTPFLGIGSELYQAIKMNRRGIGIELKESYYNQAVKNLRRAEEEKNISQGGMF